jgi:hypothetical protein
MKDFRLPAGLLLVAAAIAACGARPLQRTADGGAGGNAMAANSGSGGSAVGAGGSGMAGGSGGGGVGLGPCPAQPPVDGDPCQHDAVTCSWGDDVRGDMCRTRASCNSSRWHVVATTCPPLEDKGACPPDTSEICTMDTTCTMANGTRCRCTDCRPDVSICRVGPPAWFCPLPETASGCPPTTEPNFGSPCDVEGAVCTYYTFMCGQRLRVCSKGLWTPGEATTSCPVSTRRAKKDIRYLSQEDIESIAQQALRLRLATYEYKAPSGAGRRHLGFIIEDSPTAPAVDRDGNIVDLYGYTSMLLAATQAQQQKIQSLQNQVEALSQELHRLEHRADRRKPLSPD